MKRLASTRSATHIPVMQLDLGQDPRTEKLRHIHGVLIERFVRIVRPQEKRRDPEWTLVLGVIGCFSGRDWLRPKPIQNGLLMN